MRADDDLPRKRSCAGNRIHRVANEVQENLFDLETVSHDQWQVTANLLLQDDIVPFEICPHQRHDFLDDCDDTGRHLVGARQPHQRSEPADNVRGAANLHSSFLREVAG